MNLDPTREALCGKGQRMKPCFNTFYNIGQRFAGQLRPIRSVAEVAANLGMEKRRVQTIAYLALGKLIWGLCESVKELEALEEAREYGRGRRKAGAPRGVKTRAQ